MLRCIDLPRTKGEEREAKREGGMYVLKGRKWSVGSGRYQLVIPTLQHDGRKMLHDGVGLDVKVTEHRIGVPAAKELDGISINVLVE